MRNGLLMTSALALCLVGTGIAEAQQNNGGPQTQHSGQVQQTDGQRSQSQAIQRIKQAHRSLEQAAQRSQQSDGAGAPAKREVSQSLRDLKQALEQAEPNQQNRQPYQQAVQSVGRAEQAVQRSGDRLNDQAEQAVDDANRALVSYIDAVDRSLSPNGQRADAGGGARIQVEQARPQVTVRQSQPEVTVTQSRPEVAVTQPRPEVTVQQAEPRVEVERAGEPQVTVERQGEPEVNVQQRHQAGTDVRGAAAPEGEGQQMSSTTDGRSGSRAADPSIDQPTTPDQAASVADRIEGMPDNMRAEELIGRDVYSMRGDDIGNVEDLIVDAQSGRIQEAVIGVGGFLGIGERNVAVAFDQLRFDRDRQALVVDTTREQLEQSPEFAYGDATTSLRDR